MQSKSLLAVLAAFSLGATAAADVSIRSDLPGGYVDITGVGTYYDLGDDGTQEITSAIGNLLLPAGTHRISNNGAISWGNSGGTSFGNETIPSAALAGGMKAIAVYWDDLFTYSRPKGSEDGVFVYETADTLYVTWRLGHISAGGQATMQLQVYANGPVLAQMVYPDVTFANANFDNGANATVGYQSGEKGGDAQWSFNTAGSVPDGLVLSIVDPTAVPVSIVDRIPGAFRPITSAATRYNLGDDGSQVITTSVGNLLLPPGTHRISNNGAIAWGNTSGTSFGNESLPSNSIAEGNTALAVYWDDLFTYDRTPPARADGVYVEETSNALYVTWVLGHISAGGQATIQLQVFSCGPVYAQYVYRATNFVNANYNDGASATIGYQSGGLAGATQWSFNSSGAVHAGTVLSLIDVTAPECRADFNGDGLANSQDFFDFLTAFFAGCP